MDDDGLQTGLFCGEPSQGTSDEQEGELSNEPAVGALLLTHHGYAS